MTVTIYFEDSGSRVTIGVVFGAILIGTQARAKSFEAQAGLCARDSVAP